jgi:hypothetical protein
VSDILQLQLVFLVCGTVAFVSSLRFLRRYLELKHERKLQAPSDDVTNRLDRIEQAVESTAVEVERVAEASRFVAKLLAEREPSIGKLPKSPERVITPH